MMYTSTLKRGLAITVFALALLAGAGHLSRANAQAGGRDPFAKPSFMKPKKVVPVTPGKGVGAAGAGPAVPVNYGPPPIEARIDYFKSLRERAVAEGKPLPKVTSVLTLSEMAVSGIFKTSRGWAAMVEATPIKLSYTIYPGEKFFDGQLVAVEENQLVFRKVTKVGEGKFVASVENKQLQKYSQKAQIEGTAPSQPAEKATEVAQAAPPSAKGGKPSPNAKLPVNPFLSPVDEMNNQPPAKPSDDKAKKTGKKPATKVAKNTEPK